MRFHIAYTVLSSLAGAGFSVLAWWFDLQRKPHSKARDRDEHLWVQKLLLSLLAAPFVALGAQEAIFFKWPDAVRFPFLALLGAFVCGYIGYPIVLLAGRLALKKLEGAELPSITLKPGED